MVFSEALSGAAVRRAKHARGRGFVSPATIWGGYRFAGKTTVLGRNHFYDATIRYADIKIPMFLENSFILAARDGAWKVAHIVLSAPRINLLHGEVLNSDGEKRAAIALASLIHLPNISPLIEGNKDSFYSSPREGRDIRFSEIPLTSEVATFNWLCERLQNVPIGIFALLIEKILLLATSAEARKPGHINLSQLDVRLELEIHNSSQITQVRVSASDISLLEQALGA
ncbi:MAG: hypothetical protein WC901_07295 [Candidatus Margulisiibacteriota bacterium]